MTMTMAIERARSRFPNSIDCRHPLSNMLRIMLKSDVDAMQYCDTGMSTSCSGFIVLTF